MSEADLEDTASVQRELRKRQWGGRPGYRACTAELRRHIASNLDQLDELDLLEPPDNCEFALQLKSTGETR